ncbi:efflux RND transporter periplasmic adaptor subunit [Silvanigrella aquatica]|uniref:Uncharacterized protein n=1 Tax=Silvanigrella aquatica TaxID=1915309 RepID=A0A1L4D267_9BACT|nr:efflux RND transporter periplasmic adaptor subunit [Silvanigrella aquatica]APJ04292.1 hypothetical protein AXG55_10395 [Silvanigrella aquatica]
MPLFNAQTKIKIVFLSIILFFLIIFIAILVNKNLSLRTSEVSKKEEIDKGIRVKTTKISFSPAERELYLNGETRPYQSVTLYAKVSGYLKKINVDKGDIVKQGQVIAIIESPETDEAYLAAYANYKNKSSIAKRTIQLEKEDLVSKQESEQAVSDAKIAESQFHAQKVIKGYETIRAPFPGTITARFADQGALVQNAENSQSSALPIVTLSEVNKLRVDVYIDQHEAPYIQKDDPILIEFNGVQKKKILGHIDRLSNQLDTKTKMMLVEIDIPNADGALVAGSFVHVTIKIKTPVTMTLPVEALILQKDKSFVGVISREQKIIYRPITIENNDGKMISINGDLKEDEVIALNIGSDIPEGSKVQPILDKK